MFEVLSVKFFKLHVKIFAGILSTIFEIFFSMITMFQKFVAIFNQTIFAISAKKTYLLITPMSGATWDQEIIRGGQKRTQMSL